MENTIQENLKIEDMIFEINEKQVMLDSDLARLYQCKNGTKAINQAVKNNLEKFPNRFSWRLTQNEFMDLRSKFLTANKKYNMVRTLPRVFTEEGTAMLSTILKTNVATQVSIQILNCYKKHFPNLKKKEK